MKLKYCLLLIVICANTGYAQEENKTLSVNDVIPDYTFNALINYKSNHLKLSDIQKDLIILEFWNFYCASCIKSFPRLEFLQKKFNDRIQIFLIIDESKMATIKFFEKHKNFKMPDIPIITEDSLLRKRLPSEVMPYSVWMDNTGVIKHITGGYNITEEKITSFLLGKNVLLRDVSSAADSTKNAILFFSSLSRCSIKSEKPWNITDSNSIYFSKKCQSIADLYLTAYNEHGRHGFGKRFNVELNVGDSILFYTPLNNDLIDKWLDKYAFNYELLLPRTREADIYDIMKADLSRYFKYNVTIINKEIKGYKLLRIQTVECLPSEDMDNYESFFRRADKIWKIRNQPAEVFIRRLKMKFETEMPFGSEVFTNRLINIDIPDYIWFAQDNLRSLVNHLTANGMEIKPAVFSVDVLKIQN